jgi:hypothetical protein
VYFERFSLKNSAIWHLRGKYPPGGPRKKRTGGPRRGEKFVEIFQKNLKNRG